MERARPARAGTLLLLLLVVVVVVMASQAHAQSNSTPASSPSSSTPSPSPAPTKEPSLQEQALAAVARASNAFASDLYQVLSKQPGNVLVSPLSAAAVLALTWLGSAKHTAQQLGNALHLPEDYQHVIYGYRALFNALQARDARVRLSLASRVFVRRGLGLREGFRRLANETFLAGAEELPFDRPADAAAAINEWVRFNTQGKIDELLTPESLSESTSVVLANAVYFKGTWRTQFDPTQSSEQPFRSAVAMEAAAKAGSPEAAREQLRGRAKNVTLMTLTGDFPFARLHDLRAFALRLPYVGGRVSLLALLPEAVDGLPELEAALAKAPAPQGLEGVLAQLRTEEVNVWLPRFALKASVPLNHALLQLGLGGLFNGSADLSGVAASGPLALSEMLQKATIEVNEEGTEASAATGGVFFLTAADLYNFFRADHPFMFYLLDDQTGTILFQGRFVEPE